MKESDYYQIIMFLNYVTTGGGGADLYGDRDRSEWQEGDVFYSTYHYCNVTVSNSQLNVEVIKFDDSDSSTSVIDTFKINIDDSSISTTSSVNTTSNTKETSNSSTTTASIGLIPLIAGFFMVLLKKKRKDF